MHHWVPAHFIGLGKIMMAKSILLSSTMCIISHTLQSTFLALPLLLINWMMNLAVVLIQSGNPVVPIGKEAFNKRSINKWANYLRWLYTAHCQMHSRPVTLTNSLKSSIIQSCFTIHHVIVALTKSPLLSLYLNCKMTIFSQLMRLTVWISKLTSAFPFKEDHTLIVQSQSTCWSDSGNPEFIIKLPI